MIAYEHVKNIKLNPDILERNKINLRDDYLTEIKNLNLKIQVYGILFRYMYLSSGDLMTGGQGVICSSGLEHIIGFICMNTGNFMHS